MRQQRATAIITALFIMALVVIAATTIALRLEINITHTELSSNSSKMILARHSVIEWSLQQLSDIVNNEKNVATPNQPIQLEKLTQDGIKIEASIIDAQQFFNINILQRTPDNFAEAKNDAVVRAFQRLIRAVDPKMPESRALQLAFAVAKKIHESNPYADKIPKVMKKFRNVQFLEDLHKEMSRRTSRSYASLYHPTVSISEIRATPGMTQTLYNQLKPYLIALPSLTPININTSATPVLNMLNEQLTLETSQLLINERDKNQIFSSVNEFLNLPTAKNVGLQQPLSLPITTRSQYFLLKMNFAIADQQQHWQALLQIRKVNNKAKIVVLWQHLTYG